jgi:hypothetical protein
MDKLGTAIIHIIPDSYHNYIRVLQYFYEIYVKEPQYDKDTGAPKLDKMESRLYGIGLSMYLIL